VCHYCKLTLATEGAKTFALASPSYRGKEDKSACKQQKEKYKYSVYKAMLSLKLPTNY
jgi:hypothetical protein